MELKKFIIDGREVEFVNAYRNTRTGFAHDSNLFIDGRNYGDATCIYYNRTWECYTYQSVMQKLIHNLIDSRESYLKERFKRDNGYCKISGSRKDALRALIASDSDVVFYHKIYESL